MVTFDLVSESTSKNSNKQANLPFKNRDRKLELNHKLFDSPSRMSERSETTATNSFIRSQHTQSPTKMRRNRCNFAQSGLNVLKTDTLKQMIEFERMDLSSIDTNSPDVRDRHNGTYSPNARDRQSPA